MVKVRQSRELSLFNRILLWVNYFFVIALLVGLTAKYISPHLFWLIAFFGLGFPYLVLLNIIFVIYWISQFRREALISLTAILLCTFTIRKYVQITFSNSGSNEEIKVTSYNSMLFDLYNWSKNLQSRQHILDQLQEINPDILCLQEFYNNTREKELFNIDTVVSTMNTKYYHVEYTTTTHNQNHFGIATFSKYPIVNKGKIIFNTRSNNICIYTDVLIEKDTLRIYNMHLQSISFNESDYKFISDLQDTSEAENEYENSKTILRRLKRAFVKRAEQAELIHASVKNCPYKIILCGDFNDTPASYAYNLISENLKDAFVEKGSGFGKTYAGKFPQFRIDYIFHSTDMECTKFVRSTETITDHFPITSYLKLKH